MNDDAARDLEVSESNQTSAYLTDMSLKDFSQMFEDAHRLNSSGDYKKEWSADLIQLRTALSSRFASCGAESPSQKLMRDTLIAESLTNICNVIGVE